MNALTILLILSVIAPLALAIAAAVLLRKKAKTLAATSKEQVKVLQEAILARQQLVANLETAKAKYISKEEFRKVEKKLGAIQTQQATERRQHQVTLAEIETGQIRLKELEGIVAQYEKTIQETKKELDDLSKEEADINRSAEDLRNRLQTTFVQLDKLLEELAESRGATEQLHAVKTQLSELEQKILFYESDTAVLKTKYLELKASYDALDVEYAQLYERHGTSG